MKVRAREKKLKFQFIDTNLTCLPYRKSLKMTQTTPIRKLTADKLKVRVYETRAEMGAEAAKDVAKKIKELLSFKQGTINIIFAAAPSQIEFLSSLSQEQGIDWGRVNGFHMD